MSHHDPDPTFDVLLVIALVAAIGAIYAYLALIVIWAFVRAVLS